MKQVVVWYKAGKFGQVLERYFNLDDELKQLGVESKDQKWLNFFTPYTNSQGERVQGFRLVIGVPLNNAKLLHGWLQKTTNEKPVNLLTFTVGKEGRLKLQGPEDIVNRFAQAWELELWSDEDELRLL